MIFILRGSESDPRLSGDSAATDCSCSLGLVLVLFSTDNLYLCGTGPLCETCKLTPLLKRSGRNSTFKSQFGPILSGVELGELHFRAYLEKSTTDEHYCWV